MVFQSRGSASAPMSELTLSCTPVQSFRVGFIVRTSRKSAAFRRRQCTPLSPALPGAFASSGLLSPLRHWLVLRLAYSRVPTRERMGLTVVPSGKLRPGRVSASAPVGGCPVVMERVHFHDRPPTILVRGTSLIALFILAEALDGSSLTLSPFWTCVRSDCLPALKRGLPPLSANLRARAWTLHPHGGGSALCGPPGHPPPAGAQVRLWDSRLPPTDFYRAAA